MEGDRLKTVGERLLLHLVIMCGLMYYLSVSKIALIEFVVMSGCLGWVSRDIQRLLCGEKPADADDIASMFITQFILLFISLWFVAVATQAYQFDNTAKAMIFMLGTIISDAGMMGLARLVARYPTLPVRGEPTATGTVKATEKPLEKITEKAADTVNKHDD
jgi:hypothetical protein